MSVEPENIPSTMQSEKQPGIDNEVLRLADIPLLLIKNLLQKYRLELMLVETDIGIPGSFWGEPEAGLIENKLYARMDTPIHSVLHEACHYICMSPDRRIDLDTNAGGHYDEENAVCYLQILLADAIPGLGRSRMLQDMDAWGYSFRLGSARTWFEQDADDARRWLQEYGIISADEDVLGCRA